MAARSKTLTLATVGLLTIGLSTTPPVGAEPTEDKVPTAVGSGGAVATVDHDATKAGLEVLEDGGNAVDAAVAALAVLGVTEPYSCGIGGGGFLTVYNADDERVTTIEHREKAPSAMKPDSFFQDGKPMEFDEARYSGMSAGVPGTVAGWDKALKRFGTRSLQESLEPAVDIAKNGFKVDQTYHDQTEDNREYFDDIKSSKKTFLDADGKSPAVGSIVKNRDLAKTYEKIGRDGASAFYRGKIADAMVKSSTEPPLTSDADHEWLPGVMTKKDAKSYVAREQAPTHVKYRDKDIYGMAPPSSGGTTDGEALNILEGYNLGHLSREEALHYFLEASRFSYADRNAYIGDPRFENVPTKGLLSDDFAAERRTEIGGKAANPPVVEPGDPWPHNGGGTGVARPTQKEETGRSTTHLTVADDEGNVVSYTDTIESTGGSGITVPGHGFLLNNELTDFNYEELDHPNSVEGGKTPRSSMSPTIVLDDGKPVLAAGSPGGSTIITTVLQILIDKLDLGATLPEAIAAPRASQRNSSSTEAEPDFIDSPYGKALVKRGHKFSETSSGEIGAATGIEIRDDGTFVAAAEPERRGGGSAGVVDPE